jgi:hypothetical protein
MSPFCVYRATIGAAGYVCTTGTGGEAHAEDLRFGGTDFTDSEVEFFQHRDFRTPSLGKNSDGTVRSRERTPKAYSLTVATA